MDDAGFVAAGYGITWAALIWYAWRLRRRAREAREELAGRTGGLAEGTAARADAERDPRSGV